VTVLCGVLVLAYVFLFTARFTRQGWLSDETALSQQPHAAHRSYLLEFLTGASPLGPQDTFVPQSVRSMGFGLVFVWILPFAKLFTHLSHHM
jgi:hypothetical protein